MLARRGVRLETVRVAITEMLHAGHLTGPDGRMVADSRTYAIKRTQRTGTATTVAIVVGKEAAIRAIYDYDHRLAADERASGWEHYFEPAGDTRADAGTPPSNDSEA